jgi:hypothetical protein
LNAICRQRPHRLLYVGLERKRSAAVSKQHPSDGPASGERADRGLDEEPRPVSNQGLAIFFAALAAALMLGYLFLNKLVDISREEDCMLSRAKNCAAIELPSNR